MNTRLNQPCTCSVGDDGLMFVPADCPTHARRPLADDPVAMALGFTPVKPGVKLPGTPEHCHLCALDEIHRLREQLRRLSEADSE